MQLLQNEPAWTPSRSGGSHQYRARRLVVRPALARAGGEGESAEWTSERPTVRLLDCLANRHRIRTAEELDVINLNSGSLDELAARIGRAIEASPARDIEKNVRALLASGLARLDLVTRQEFDVQAQVLMRTREKLERMEARVADLEARFPPGGPAG
jgi:hypothetical protein